MERTESAEVITCETFEEALREVATVMGNGITEENLREAMAQFPPFGRNFNGEGSGKFLVNESVMEPGQVLLTGVVECPDEMANLQIRFEPNDEFKVIVSPKNGSMFEHPYTGEPNFDGRI